MCILYLSIKHSHIHVSCIVRGSGSVHVGKKHMEEDYMSIFQKHGAPRVMSPSSKMRLLPLSALAQYSKYLKMLPVKDNEAKGRVSRGILSCIYTSH